MGQRVLARHAARPQVGARRLAAGGRRVAQDARLLGGRVPTARTLARLARVLGWPPFEAVDRAVTRGPNRLAGDTRPARAIRMATLGPDPVEGQAERWQGSGVE